MTALEATAVLSLGPEGMAVELGAPPEPAAPEPLRVSISRRRTLVGCARRYFFEYELGRRPVSQPHEQVWGAALHRGLEFYANDIRHAAECNVEIAWDLAARDMVNAATTPGHDAEGRPYAPPADPYARAALRAMLRAYAAVWGEHDAAKYEVVAVELPFDLPVITRTGRDVRGVRCGACAGVGRVDARTDEERSAGEPVRLSDCPTCVGAGHLGARRVGRVDLVVRERPPACEKCGGRGEIGDGMLCPLECFTCKGTGRAAEDGLVWTVEHKSTGKPPGDDVYYRGIEVDPQIATYHDALSIMGYQPAGVLYDVVRRPDYHEPKPAPALKLDGTARKQKEVVAYSNPRHGETAADYEERVYQLATSKPGEWFGRREFKAGEGPLTSARIQEARLQLWSAAREIRAYQRAGVWPEVGDRYVCAPPGRRPVCPWLDVCAGREVATNDRLYPLKVKATEGVE